MGRTRFLFVCLLLSLTACVSAHYPNRGILQANVTEDMTEEEREAAREEEAMLAFQQEQDQKAVENAAIIEQGFLTATEVVEAYLAANSTTQQLEILTDLLRNADGVAFKFALNTLVNRDPEESQSVLRIAQRAINRAISDGFATNVAEAVALALTVRENEDDHLNFLDVIVLRHDLLEERNEGSGCEFVKNLFTDADSIAHERGDSMLFVASFEQEEYLQLMECFLDECTGRAGRCCSQRRAVNSGMCACDAEITNRCDFNLFSNRPRVIWICSAEQCDENEKCLCPAE